MAALYVSEYVPRVAWTDKPALIWKVTRQTPNEGLELIIDNLRAERYNRYRNDSRLELSAPQLPADFREGTRVVLQVRKDSNHYGNVAVIYKGVCTDTSTRENRTAQKYWVFFNFGENSYYERDSFL